MHKYSYELSSSYRQETYQPRQYFVPPSLPSKAAPSPLHIASKTSDNYPRAYSKTFVRSPNTEILASQQQIASRPQVYSSFQRSQSGFKVNEPLTRPQQSHQWKPNNPGVLQNRLKILSDLSERHQQAIRTTYHPPANKSQTPIRAIYQETPQDHGLKRQFSFNSFHHPPSSQRLREEIVQKNLVFAAEPLRSKNSMPNATSKRINDKEKTQLRINMNVSREKNQSRWQNENSANNFMRSKTYETNSTVTKLSSLQERIRSTVQPYLNK